MKGYIYYSRGESVRNRAFIDDLMNESLKIGIDLQLLIDEEQPDSDADFILFRDRNTERAIKFELEGFRLFNRVEVNRIANDKLRTFELATLLGVPAVPTRKIRSIDEVVSYPCVLKTIDGHGGNEVFLCTSAADAEIVFHPVPQPKTYCPTLHRIRCPRYTGIYDWQ